MNTDLAKANNIEVPYDKVREGKWTLDEWINMTKDFYKDVNGDGMPDDNEIGNETYYFFGNDELTKEQFDEYRFGEGFDILYGGMSYDEIISELTK